MNHNSHFHVYIGIYQLNQIVLILYILEYSAVISCEI